jgi:hypothetical protein
VGGRYTFDEDQLLCAVRLHYSIVVRKKGMYRL